MVLGVVSDVAAFLKVKLSGSPTIDNIAFRLHYKLTAPLLVLMSILITSNQLIGQPIDCLLDPGMDKFNAVINQYCWIHTTFSVDKHFKSRIGKAVPYHGIGLQQGGDRVTYRTYYQWVPFFLVFQAVMFFSPRWLWKYWEGGKLKTLLSGITNPMQKKEDQKEMEKYLVEYTCKTFHKHNQYAMKYYFTEFLNVANVFFNIWLLDIFLGGAFMKYGLDVLSFPGLDPKVRTDPMMKLFPRMSKCTFNVYGPTGDIQDQDAFCLLALNILNEKIFILLWFWLMVLAGVTSATFVIRLVSISSTTCRKQMLQCRGKVISDSELMTVLDNAQIGDFHILELLGKNMDNLMFGDYLRSLSEAMASNKPGSNIKLQSYKNMGN